MYGYSSGYGMTPYQQQVAQNRLNQMEQQYNTQMAYQPQYQNQMQMPQQQTMAQVIKGRPVSSMDEAKASMIDLDGSLFVFTDVANKRIYTKQIMLDGTSDFRVYQQVEEKGMNNNSNVQMTNNYESKSGEYVLRKDFDKTVKGLTDQINKLREDVGYDATDDKQNAKK